MDTEPKGDMGSKGGLTALIAAKLVCCGALVLAVTGALSGAGAWFSDGGLVWLVMTAFFAVVGVIFWGRGKLPRATRDEPVPTRRVRIR